MDADRLIALLESFPPVLGAAVSGISPAEARVRGPGDAWSIVEIVAHLADEEVEDFRERTRSTLEDPTRVWSPIDPVNDAITRSYIERDLERELYRFCAARAESVEWLRSLAAPDWSGAYQHPEFGPIRAGDLLASWAAHDQLHLRQIAKRTFELAARSAEGFRTVYAGEWGP